MSFTIDPEVAEALAPFAAEAGSTPPPAGDVAARRAALEGVFRYAGGEPGPAALYLHGGGMIVGRAGLFDGLVSRYVSASGTPILSADYRLAPEHPYPVPVEDAYAALAWLHAHAADLGVDPARIGVFGDSAGGGLAAAVSILARDRKGPAIARQILVMPMLDDRTLTPDPQLAPFVVWSWDDNRTGWQALLGDAVGGPDTPAYAAPARVADPAGLPPAYIEAGPVRDVCDPPEKHRSWQTGLPGDGGSGVQQPAHDRGVAGGQVALHRR